MFDIISTRFQTDCVSVLTCAFATQDIEILGGLPSYVYLHHRCDLAWVRHESITLATLAIADSR